MLNMNRLEMSRFKYIQVACGHDFGVWQIPILGEPCLVCFYITRTKHLRLFF